MLISVIIVSFNTKRLTLDAARSVEKYAINGESELIVVDNGSTDGSSEALQKLKLSIPYKFISNDANLGFATANNVGIKNARGRYIFLLNSDAKLTKGALISLVKFAEENPNAGIVSPALLNLDKTIQPSVYRLPTLKRAISHYWGNTHVLDKYAPKLSTPTKVESTVAAAWLITPLAINRVGSLNEKYFMYFEDLDYCRKLKKAGLFVYYLPSAKVYHYHGASAKATQHESEQWKRLIPSSKTYHGKVRYYLMFIISISAQKLGIYK